MALEEYRMKLAGSASQWLASLLLLVAAAAHVPMIPEHLQEAPYLGVLFILLSIACGVLAVVVVVVDIPGVWMASGAVCLAAVVAFLASRTVGLPQIGDDVGNWTEPMGIPAVASEATVALLAWIRLRKTADAGSPRHGLG